MAADAALVAPAGDRNVLMRHQLATLVERLRLFSLRRRDETVEDASRIRAEGFRRLLERAFVTRREVAGYARRLACSTRTLSRSCRAARGVTPKALIVARTILDAKRLLVHSDRTVAAIAEDLGFDEATNFVKFFKRETRRTPSDFRRTELRRPTEGAPGSE